MYQKIVEFLEFIQSHEAVELSRAEKREEFITFLRDEKRTAVENKDYELAATFRNLEKIQLLIQE